MAKPSLLARESTTRSSSTLQKGQRTRSFASQRRLPAPHPSTASTAGSTATEGSGRPPEDDAAGPQTQPLGEHGAYQRHRWGRKPCWNGRTGGRRRPTPDGAPGDRGERFSARAGRRTTIIAPHPHRGALHRVRCDPRRHPRQHRGPDDARSTSAPRKGIKRIVCLGDIIGYGPNPRECLKELYRSEIAIMGNHEEAVMFYGEDFNPKAQRLARVDEGPAQLARPTTAPRTTTCGTSSAPCSRWSRTAT